MDGTARPFAERPRRRIVSISFDTPDVEWIDGVVDLLRSAGYPKAGRSEVVRLAVIDLREAVAGRSRPDIVKLFLDREAARLLASLDRPPRLPFG